MIPNELLKYGGLDLAEHIYTCPSSISINFLFKTYSNMTAHTVVRISVIDCCMHLFRGATKKNTNNREGQTAYSSWTTCLYLLPT